MKRSLDRILTTHVGSLPRPADLLEMNDARANGRPVDTGRWAARVKSAIGDVVRMQREAGVDIVNDGELSKSSWSSYVNDRLGGFAESVSRGQGSLATGRDKKAFQEFYDEYDRIQPFRTNWSVLKTTEDSASSLFLKACRRVNRTSQKIARSCCG